MDQTLQTWPTHFDLSHELERHLMTSLVLVTVPCCFVIGGIFFFHVGVPLARTHGYLCRWRSYVANVPPSVV